MTFAPRAACISLSASGYLLALGLLALAVPHLQTGDPPSVGFVAADVDGVYAYFGTKRLISLDMIGQPVWPWPAAWRCHDLP